MIPIISMNQIDLSPFCKTKSEAIDFSKRLAVISAKLYQTNFNLEKEVLAEFGLMKKDKFISLLQENEVSTASVPALKDFFEKVQQTASTLPVLSLTLAFEPQEQTLSLLSQWFLLNIKKQVLFDITVNPSLIAGISLSYQGKYKDFSIKQKFDTLVTDMLNKPQQANTPATQHQAINTMHMGRWIWISNTTNVKYYQYPMRVTSIWH